MKRNSIWPLLWSSVDVKLGILSKYNRVSPILTSFPLRREQELTEREQELPMKMKQI